MTFSRLESVNSSVTVLEKIYIIDIFISIRSFCFSNANFLRIACRLHISSSSFDFVCFLNAEYAIRQQRCPTHTQHTSRLYNNRLLRNALASTSTASQRNAEANTTWCGIKADCADCYKVKVELWPKFNILGVYLLHSYNA